MRIAVALVLVAGCSGEIRPVDLPTQVAFEVEAQRIPGAMHRVRHGPAGPIAVGGLPDPFLLERDLGTGVWVPMSLPETWRGTVRDASTVAGEVFVTGDEGQIARGPLGSLEVVDGPVDGAVRGVFAAGVDDVYFAADTGLFHFDGEAVAPIALTGSTATAAFGLRSVWGTAGALFAVGEDGVAIVQDAGEPVLSDTGTVGTLRAVHGRSAREVYAVGGDQVGAVLRWDGVAWSDMPAPDMPPLYDVFAGEDGLYVTGFAGYLAHYDGVQWEAIETPATITLTGLVETEAGVFMTGGNVAAPAASGFVMRYRP